MRVEMICSNRPFLAARPLARPRPRLAAACAIDDVRPAADGLRTSELRALLRSRGIDTTGIFEREELVRLLAVAPPSNPHDSVHDLPLQVIMDELEERGVAFDVLAPTPQLAQLLVEARAHSSDASRAGASGPSPGPQPQPHRAASRAPAARDGGGAGPPADTLEGRPPATSAAAAGAASKGTELLPVAHGVAAGLGKLLSTVFAGLPLPAEWSVPDPPLLKRPLRLGARAKVLLLLFCLCALRYGLVRAVLALTSLKLSQELLSSAVDTLFPSRSKRGQRREDSEAGGAAAT